MGRSGFFLHEWEVDWSENEWDGVELDEKQWNRVWERIINIKVEEESGRGGTKGMFGGTSFGEQRAV